MDRMTTLECPKCKRQFEGKSSFSVSYELEQHIKYCNLPTIHKVLQVLLFPLAIITIAVLLLGFPLVFILLPIGYPFAYATNLLLDGKVLKWDEYTKWTRPDNYVRSFRKR
jgi:hypothetical protein